MMDQMPGSYGGDDMPSHNFWKNWPILCCLPAAPSVQDKIGRNFPFALISKLQVLCQLVESGDFVAGCTTANTRNFFDNNHYNLGLAPISVPTGALSKHLLSTRFSRLHHLHSTNLKPQDCPRQTTPLIAPSDDAMETPDPSGERRNSHGTFHRYLHLPFELRAEIRAFAIMGCHSTGENCRSRLALVSKEWQVDVEKSLFSKIQIDPLNEEGVSDFKKYFTDGREKYLTQLEIPMDDSAVTGLWERSNGLLGISQLMEKTGQLFQHLNGWNLSSDGRKQSSIAVIFTSLNEFRGDYWRVGKFEDQMMQTVSLWEPNRLSGVTEGDIPTNVALWAIKSEFPSSLNMVTHLSFNIDCVPIAAAKRIIQVMPNLESCNFQMIFTCEVEEAWKDLTGEFAWTLSFRKTIATDVE